MYKLNRNFVMRKFSEETILLNRRTNDKIHLNSTATLILEKLIRTLNYKDEILSDVDLSSVNEQEVLVDIENTVEHMIKEKLITI